MVGRSVARPRTASQHVVLNGSAAGDGAQLPQTGLPRKLVRRSSCVSSQASVRFTYHSAQCSARGEQLTARARATSTAQLETLQHCMHGNAFSARSETTNPERSKFAGALP